MKTLTTASVAMTAQPDRAPASARCHEATDSPHSASEALTAGGDVKDLADLEQSRIRHQVNGTRNRIGLPDSVMLDNVSIQVEGADNVITIGEGCRLSSVAVEIQGNGCVVTVGARCRIVGRMMLKGNGAAVAIGDETSFERAALLALEGRLVRIGRNCMLSYDIMIRTSDAHSILDLDTHARINPPGDVIIGDHVWIGAGTFVSKGVQIADDCIIGMKSVVTKSHAEPHCALAGVPARVVRARVTWDRQLVDPVLP